MPPPLPLPAAPAKTLADLKPGDEVAIDAHNRPSRLVRVERITPTGRIVADGMQFKPDGWICGNDRIVLWRLAIPTEDDRVLAAWDRVAEICENLGDRKMLMDLPSLIRLVSALEAIEAETTPAGPD